MNTLNDTYLWVLINSGTIDELETHKWHLMTCSDYESRWMALALQTRIDELLKFKA